MHGCVKSDGIRENDGLNEWQRTSRNASRRRRTGHNRTMTVTRELVEGKERQQRNRDMPGAQSSGKSSLLGKCRAPGGCRRVKMAFAETISLGHVKKSLECQVKKLGHFPMNVTGGGDGGGGRGGVRRKAGRL